MKRRVLVLVMLVTLAFNMFLVGCGNKEVAQQGKSGSKEETVAKTEESSGEKEPDKQDPTEEKVELTYYVPNTPQSDVKTVNDHLNSLIEPEINASVKFNIIDWGAYEQKMNVMMAAGESYDLCFTSTWSNNFYQNVAKGAYLPLDDLLATYAPGTLEVVPQQFWEVSKVGGQIYGVNNFQQAAAGFGLLIRKDLADTYGLDWKNLKGYNDITPFLEQVKANEPTVIPFGYDKQKDPFIRSTTIHGFEGIGDTTSPGWVYLDDDKLTMVNQFDSPEFKEHCALMRDWYKKGYIRQDAATLKDVASDKKASMYAVENGQIDIGTLDWENLGMPYKGRMAVFGEKESYDVKFIEPILTTEKAAATLTAISRSSKNPERAMMFIELLNTNKDIYNTMVWGVEGKHYTKKNDVAIEVDSNGGYAHYSAWEFGFMGNSLLDMGSWPEGADEVVDGLPKAHRAWMDVNKNATPSPTLGFIFDFEHVKGEIATCRAVVDEMYFSIASGSVDPDKYIPLFNEKLEAAGMQKIMDEKQRQINEWKASK